MSGETAAMGASRVRDYGTLAVFVAICLAIAALGGLATATSVETWYPTLVKPVFNPPNWLFGPVWTVLYLMMAVAGWRVWRCGGSPIQRRAMLAYAIQLLLNLIWSILFFGLRLIGFAFVEIIALLTAIVVTALLFWRVDRPAGLLFVPYAAWVAFATVLNGAIWRLN